MRLVRMMQMGMSRDLHECGHALMLIRIRLIRQQK